MERAWERGLTSDGNIKSKWAMVLVDIVEIEIFTSIISEYCDSMYAAD